MIATALESNGAIVYIVGRRKEALERVAEERAVRTSPLFIAVVAADRPQKHGNIIAIQGDISSKESLKAVTDTIKQRHGYINLLVNNAGVLLGQQPKLPTPAEVGGDITRLQALLWETETAETFRATFDVNVAGEPIYPVAEVIAGRNLPLVFSTGYGGAGIREPFRDRPVVQKPFSQADLKRTLIAAMKAARA